MCIRDRQYIYRQLRGSDPPDEETARGIIDKLFFSDKRYNLGDVGRYKINRKLDINIDKETLAVSYTHLRAHETVLDLVCRLLLEKNTKRQKKKEEHQWVTHNTGPI